MYNPYNWTKKEKNNDVEMEMPVFPGAMGYNCILNELAQVSNELEMARLKYNELKKDFEETEEQLSSLEYKKKDLMKRMYDG